jgi:hypothetical protein
MTADQLPPSVRALLGGASLEEKIGSTVLLIVAGQEGWPRVASLSVGEILATSGTRLFLTLYDKSRTTRALATTGRGLLLLVDDGAIVKVAVTAVPVSEGKSPGRSAFCADVVSVERDEVPYATVTHGVEFELVDGAGAVNRWRKQLADLQELGGRFGTAHRELDPPA